MHVPSFHHVDFLDETLFFAKEGLIYLHSASQFFVFIFRWKCSMKISLMKHPQLTTLEP